MNKKTKTIIIFVFMLGFIPTAEAKLYKPYQENSLNKNSVVAHRGAWKNDNLPQNSIASLKNAIKLGCAGSEFDMHLTSDDVVVVNHDHTFEGMNIETTKYSELSKKKLENGEKIPKLIDFLKVGLEKNTILFLELKPSAISKTRSLQLAKKVTEQVIKMRAQHKVVYMSFDHDILKRIMLIDNKAKTMYLGGNRNIEQLKTDGIYGSAYHFNQYTTDDNWISNAKNEGIKTNVWTVNDTLLMDYFLARNTDFITTDEPEILLKKYSKVNSGTKWELIWTDEFNKPGLPDILKWNYDTRGNSYGWGNNEAQWYNEANHKNTTINDGILKIIARDEPTSGKQYSSGRITTKGKGDWKYCKVEVRAKLPSGIGTWPAIWMLSSENTYGSWPKSGEIDIMEQVGYDPDSVHSTVHTQKYNHVKGTQVGKAIAIKTANSQFHVYTTEWDENEIRTYVDGKLFFNFKNEKTGFEAWPFDQEFHIILNLAIGGNWGGKHGIDKSKFPHTFEIDYVRVFEKVN